MDWEMDLNVEGRIEEYQVERWGLQDVSELQVKIKRYEGDLLNSDDRWLVMTVFLMVLDISFWCEYDYKNRMRKQNW